MDTKLEEGPDQKTLSKNATKNFKNFNEKKGKVVVLVVVVVVVVFMFVVVFDFHCDYFFF